MYYLYVYLRVEKGIKLKPISVWGRDYNGRKLQAARSNIGCECCLLFLQTQHQYVGSSWSGNRRLIDGRRTPVSAPPLPANFILGTQASAWHSILGKSPLPWCFKFYKNNCISIYLFLSNWIRSNYNRLHYMKLTVSPCLYKLLLFIVLKVCIS